MAAMAQKQVVMLLGLEGSGKSTVGNILVGEKVFPVGEKHETKHWTFPHNQSSVDVIDTVGLNDKELRKSPTELVKQWATAALIPAEMGGIHAFLVCINMLSLSSRFSLGILDELEGMANFWPYTTLVLTHSAWRAKARSQTEILDTFDGLAGSLFSPSYLRSLKVNVGGRIVFVEAEENVSAKRMEIMKWVEETPGFYTNDMLIEARHLWQRYKAKAGEMSQTPAYQDLASAIVSGARTAERPFRQVLDYLSWGNRHPEYVWPRLRKI
jgi:hypothetical protein